MSPDKSAYLTARLLTAVILTAHRGVEMFSTNHLEWTSKKRDVSLMVSVFSVNHFCLFIYFVARFCPINNSFLSVSFLSLLPPEGIILFFSV